MSIQINKVTNANVYLAGGSLLGRASEVEIASLPVVMAAHEGLGLIGKTEYPTGFDMMEASITFNAFYSDVLRQFTNPFNNLNLQIRANVDVYNAQGRSEQVGYVAHMVGAVKNIPGGSLKQLENVDGLKFDLTVYSLRVVMGGVEAMAFDATANIFRVNGEDQLATYRANIGG